MNTKLTLAVLFALVSVSLCDLPAPSKELVDKYEGYKTTFYRRITNALTKIQEEAGPMVGSDPQLQVFKDFLQNLMAMPAFQAAGTVAGNVGHEASPLVDKARATLLGLYEAYLRDHIGGPLDRGIQNIKPYLDAIMPAE